VRLFFYQDVPYATQFREHTNGIIDALAAAGAVITPEVEDITETIGGKLRLVSVFGSQFKQTYIAPKIEETARRVDPSSSRLGELRFRVTRLPGPVDAVSLSSRRTAVERAATDVASWYRRHGDAGRIRILTPVPVARWADDMSVLLDAFPRAILEVHVSEEYAGEIDALTSPRIEVRVVGGREMAWLVRLCRCALSRPASTILLTGEALARWAWLARAVLFPSDPLAATRMNDLVLCLGAIAACEPAATIPSDVSG
jgi:hypothetical protein